MGTRAAADATCELPAAFVTHTAQPPCGLVQLRRGLSFCRAATVMPAEEASASQVWSLVTCVREPLAWVQAAFRSVYAAAGAPRGRVSALLWVGRLFRLRHPHVPGCYAEGAVHGLPR